MKRSIGVNDNEKRIFKSTYGKDEHEFELDGPDYKDYNGGEWTYRVWAKGCSYFFEFRVVYFNDKYVRIDMMTNHNRPEYMKKGIAEYLIPTVAKDLNKKILSSRRSNSAEPRTQFAEDFWKKMVGKKKARYRHEMERYEFVSEETLD